jgi:hypothetical protein
MRSVKAFLPFFLFFIYSPLFSQGGTNITKPHKDYPDFQIGAIGSIDMCFRTLENKQKATSIDHLIDSRNQDETVKLGYHAGIGFCMNISRNFGMEVGVVYSNQGYETKLKDYINPLPGPGMPIKGRSIYNYNFINVPLKANFFIGKGKVRFYTSVGVITNVLVGQNETFVKKYGDGRTEYEVFNTNNPFQKVIFSGTIAAGIDVKFNKALNLRLSPNFSHSIGRFSDAPLSEYLWNAGFSADFYFGWH